MTNLKTAVADGLSKRAAAVLCTSPDSPCAVCTAKAGEILQLAYEAACEPAVDEAINGTLEFCARLIDDHQETVAETEAGSSRHLTLRKKGNLTGLAYAEKIRECAAFSKASAKGARS